MLAGAIFVPEKQEEKFDGMDWHVCMYTSFMSAFNQLVSRTERKTMAQVS